METSICFVSYTLFYHLPFANMILVLATSRGVVTAARKATCGHKNTLHTSEALFILTVTWHFIIFILEFLLTPLKNTSLWLHPLDWFQNRKHTAKSLPTCSAAWQWCLSAYQRGDGIFYMLKFKRAPQCICFLGKKLTNLCAWGILWLDPRPGLRGAAAPPWVSGVRAFHGLSSWLQSAAVVSAPRQNYKRKRISVGTFGIHGWVFNG